MKKKVLLILGLILIPLVSIWLCSFGNQVSNKKDKVDPKNTIAMYAEGEDGEYNQINESTFPKEGYVLNVEKSSCKNGGSLSQDASTKTISLSVKNAESCTLYFDKEEVPPSKDTLEILGITSNGMRTNFDDPATTDEGIFEMEDDYGTSYYYRGAVTNNYVKFAGFYWRIIRVNGDGSLRIIYDGTKGYANGTNNADRFIKKGQPYNIYQGTGSRDVKFVGWMYGPAGTTKSTSKEQAQTNIADSTIKGVVDAWYKTNIEDKGYGNAVSDTLFCNDRSTPGKEVTEWNFGTELGYGENNTAYGAFGRFLIGNDSTDINTGGHSARVGIQPTFKCPQKNDAFTVNDTSKGNGALTYPIGLITADEIVAAGSGKLNTNNISYYLYNPSGWYWSISPYYFYFSMAFVFVTYTSGSLNGLVDTYDEGAIAPVINLSAEYVQTMKGTGTMTDPYQA